LNTLFWLDLLIATAAVATALSVRPWRLLSHAPWPALLLALLLPLVWSVGGGGGEASAAGESGAAIAVLQPLSGSCLLMLMLGWPGAVLMLVPMGLGMLITGLAPDEALHRAVWLGVAPATLALLMGAGLRRWLPNHLFIYILGRGFFITALAAGLAGAASSLLHGLPPGLDAGDLMLARGLAASGDAFITGMLVAIFVAFRPHWLATYSDRLYLPRQGAV
jgi:uncharacterized membrane protein